jgi:hypothetical protein
MHVSRWLLLSLVAACGDNFDAPIEEVETPAAPTCNEADLPNTLAALEGVTAATETPCGDFVVGTPRCFLVQFDQAIAHDRDDSKRFSQRLFLIHRGCDRANLVADWGYSNDDFFDDELGALYQTNSLWIEHRYQGESIPEAVDWDWTALTIKNGATDMHEVITAFRKHYGGRFVTTGASKGGITATYHKYFFSNDVDGSIPYVAPASRERIDPLYQAYLDTQLPSPCAQNVRNAQVAALTSRRPMMLAELGALAPGFEALYLEYIVGSFDWAFWQYYGVSLCNRIPTDATPDESFWNFFASISGISNVAGPATRDDEQSYGALYYEWLTEQGFALQVGAHVAPLIVEPEAKSTMEENFAAQFPGVPLPAYDGAVTANVRRWARNHADDLLLIYGQFDPWSGGAMEASIRPTSARFFVPGATHGAQITALEPADEIAALDHASRMFGHEPRASKREAAAAGAIRQTILDRHMLREQAMQLRMKLRR